MSLKKILFIVIDGISDRLIDNKTPLDSARTPNLDYFAKIGINGIMDTIAPGVRPGSDTAHLALLGYNPHECYSGRGPIEAAGSGIELKEGDVAFRANFGTVEGEGSIFDKVVVDRRAGRIDETDELVKALNKIDLSEFGVKVMVRRGTGHRAAVVFRGEGLSDRVTDTDPKKIGSKVKMCKALDENAEKTARIINKFMEEAHRILENHPVNLEREKNGLLKGNAILLRGGGMVKKVESFEERFGLKLAFIAGTTLIKGIGKIIGADVLEVEGVTGNKHTNLKNKFNAALEALNTHDFVLVHIKATDELGHDGDFEGKKSFIEKIDQEIAVLRELDFTEICLVITADHSTPINVKDHTADPVPVIVVHEGVRTDEVDRFSELVAYRGGLCRIRGIDLFNIVLDLTNNTSKFGA
ncbi:phosphoglycerate mutase [Archaeoglobus sulfaticallidus PM70-1]|uniref:2,3-bisphosphoglycerate-independent phosphoglycerate mutase n=1 Tax=Archaeoglobus sulfaticallidus PM70-1 TaxID=387631 RepID=N0BJ54_9EURY|nr:2,3-bisphosphoglycerate-independent phosphoglycerate mutase [Archaeoglobus sulfaticallidus]AGK60491.1 phosphoglycerate mutase [Archaeoglobus sulfaticallidus PM70-1]